MKIWAFSILIALLVSCAPIDSNVSRLRTTQSAIILYATTVDKLCDLGYLEEDKCTSYSILYQKAKELYTIAVEIELIYLEAKINNLDAKEIEAPRDDVYRNLTSLKEELEKVANEYQGSPTSNNSLN